MTSWTFPTTAPANAYRSLPVWTLTPNWKSPVLERVEFLTDIMSSEIAVEQRRAARRYPRRSFEAQFLRTDSERSRMDVFMAGVGRGFFLVPLWHEQYRLNEGLVNPYGVIYFPAGTLVNREYNIGDLVMIQQDASRYAILTVTDRNEASDYIVVAGQGDVGVWPATSRITPLRRARMIDPPSISNPTDRVGEASLRFTLSDSDSRFVASWGYCAPLWRIKPTRSTAITVDYARSDFELDFQAGVAEITDPGNRAQISTQFDLTLFGRAEVAKFRSFLYMARGRARRFYVPTFTRDVVPVEDLNGPVFDATVNGFSQYMTVPQEARRILSVTFKDGRPTIYRNIISIEPVLSPVSPFPQIAERFTMDPPMPPILERDIDTMTFVVPSRFDQDSFEIAHMTDDSRAVKASIVTRSSVFDGMPPIECWVTSKPYPIDALEIMTGGIRILDSDMHDTYHTQSMLENINSQIRMIDSTIQRILVTYDRYDIDRLGGNISLLGGTLA